MATPEVPIARTAIRINFYDQNHEVGVSTIARWTRAIARAADRSLIGSRRLDGQRYGLAFGPAGPKSCEPGRRTDWSHSA